MNSTTDHESTLDYILSLVLRIGLSVSFVTVLIGGILFLWQYAGEELDYHVFKAEPNSFTHLINIFEGAWHDRVLAILQIGIVFLIATPVIRVISCFIVFAAERDFLYVTLSTIVLTVLLFSFL